MIPVTGGVIRAAIRSKLQQMGDLLFFVQKELQLPALVVLLQPILVGLQQILRSQGAKDGYITPKYALLPNRRRAFFLAVIFPISFD